MEILAKVRQKGLNAKLVMVGDGPESSAVRHRARQLEVIDFCEFVGKQPKIVDYISIADLVLLPSEQESFGLSALEAQACEAPVIATRIGGIPEVVNDGETGFLSEIGNVEKMSEDTIKLLEDKNLRDEFGKRGRELAIARYSTDKIIPQYIGFYEKVLAKNKK